MCGQRGDHGYLNSPELNIQRENLPIEKWIQFIDDVKAFNPMINIRGGEPLLYPHIVEFMRHVKESNLFLSLETNATYLKKFAYDVARYVDHISISVDGPPETHDYVRGKKGTYNKVKEGILEFKKACKVLKIKKIDPISFNCTIGVDNYKDIPDMIWVSKDLGVKSILLSLSYYFDEAVGKEYEEVMKQNFGLNAVSWSGFYKEKRDIDYDLLVENIRSLLNNKEGVKFHLNPNITDESIKNWYKDSSIPVCYDRCYVPWFMVNIMPNGDVNFCCDFNDYIIGNITENSLLDLWFNEKSERFRKEILKNRFSICKRCGVNNMFPYNRCTAYNDLKIPMKILNAVSKIPIINRKTNKYTFLIHGFD